MYSLSTFLPSNDNVPIVQSYEICKNLLAVQPFKAVELTIIYVALYLMLCRYSEFHAFAIFRQLTDYVLLFIILHWLRHYYLSWCLVTCRHFENNSDRLFKKFFFFAFINKSFSSRHKLHRFDPALYAATCFIMDHLMWWSRFPIFNFQICFDNSVSLAYFTYRKDLVWLRYLCLKSLAVTPI